MKQRWTERVRGGVIGRFAIQDIIVHGPATLQFDKMCTNRSDSFGTSVSMCVFSLGGLPEPEKAAVLSPSKVL